MIYTTLLSTNGQVFIAKGLRTKLKLKPGMQFILTVKNGKIILKPVKE